MTALADSVADAAARLGICVAQTYIEIKQGRLIARKAGRRTLVLREDQQRWLDALPIMGAHA